MNENGPHTEHKFTISLPGISFNDKRKVVFYNDDWDQQVLTSRIDQWF